MSNLRSFRILAGTAVVSACFASFAPSGVCAALFTNFAEAGTAVVGFQDDFNGAAGTPGSSWSEVGGDAATNFALSGSGSLIGGPANSDPNKLLLNTAGYSSTNQNVLALIRVTTAGSGDGFRGGVATLANASNAQGINLLFRDNGQNGTGLHFNLLDDAVAWGPASTDNSPANGDDTWTTGSYKWLRVVTNGSTHQVKIWDAGATPEPAGFDFSWTQGTRSGLAGLATNSVGGAGVFEVDYVLIQASGLESITAVPEPASLGLLSLGGLALLRRRRA